ncbi:MAG TPA: O-antigen ligase family protein [Candidatus Limnocylindria bacterium]
MTTAVRWTAGGALALAVAALAMAGAYRPVEAPPALGVAAAVVAATLAAAMVVLAVARPWSGLLLLAAALPIVNVARAEAVVGPVQVLPATIVIAALAVGALLDRTPDRAEERNRWPTWIAMILGAGLAVVATLAAPSRDDAVNITLHGVLEPLALFAVAFALRPTLRQVSAALLAVAAGVVVATLLNFAWLLIVVGPRDLYEQRMLFARLTYFNVGIFGTMLVVALPAAASVVFAWPWASRRRVATLVGWAAIGLIILALFFTYTKSAWLSAALVAALMVLLLVRGWRRRLALLAVIALLLAVVVPYPLAALRVVAPGVAAAYESLLVGMQGEGRVESWDPDTYNGSGSIGIRLEAVGAAAEITAQSPLLGVGPGGFQAEFERIRPDASVPELQSAHNLLPNLAAEYGLPFALLAAIGLALVLWRALGTRRSTIAPERITGVAVALALIGFVAMATLFGNDLYRPYRTMNGDVLAVALLAGLAWSLPGGRAASAGAAGPEAGEPLDQPADLGPSGRDEFQRPDA